MKTLITLFVLLFSSMAVADDISDFQIEGISIGDSLLEYFSEEEINAPNKYYFRDNKFIGILIWQHSSFKVYDGVSFVYKPNTNYKIHSISGSLNYKNNIKDCYNKQDEIVSEISNLFKNISNKKYVGNYPADETGNSKSTNVEFNLSKNIIRVTCYDISEKKTLENNWWDSLDVELMTSEFWNFLNEVHYQ